MCRIKLILHLLNKSSDNKFYNLVTNVFKTRFSSKYSAFFPAEVITDFMMLKMTLFPIKYLLISDTDGSTLCSL
jgi:hypothetical protein